MYVPFLGTSKEFKTKPAQNALNDLRGFGIVPDCVVVRTDEVAPASVAKKISLFGGVSENNVLLLPNADTVYRVPLTIAESGLHQILMKFADLHEEPDLLGWKKIMSDNRLLAVLLFSLGQLLLWWFVPPLSTRYALAGFITLAIVYCVAIEDWLKKQPVYGPALAITILLAVSINLGPRLIVGYRNLKYIYHQPSLTEYVSQFYDGSIDSHLQKWYQLP